MRRRSAALALVALLAGSCSNSGNGDGAATPSPSSSVASSPTPSVVSTAAPPPAFNAAATIAALPKQRLSWRGCGGGFECSTLKVPLDYRNPARRTIDVAVIRLRASGKASERIGAVVMNPGGPGGSGLDFARTARELFRDEMLRRFDVVSFDPRGIGASTPVNCLSDRELDRLLAADPSPDTPAEKQHLIDVSKQFADQCARRHREMLPFLGTVDVARDLEVLRIALAEPKLTYLGYSYGTVLGTQYAEQFPRSIRALVLDGALDPSLDFRAVEREQAMGFDNALKAWFGYCRGTSSCSFRSNGDLPRAYDELTARIDRAPLSARAFPGRKLGPSEALFGVAAALYSRQYGWPTLGDALTEAQNGDGSTLLRLFDSLVERRDNGSYSNSVEAQISVACVDTPFSRTVADYDRDAAEFRKVAPRFGIAVAYGALACAYWGVPAVTVPAPAQTSGNPPVLVVGTTRDPATPYKWSQALAAQISNARLVTYDGDGHTAYGYGRAPCIDRVVNAYFIALTVPPAGTRC